jgi:hypothetical protein
LTALLVSLVATIFVLPSLVSAGETPSLVVQVLFQIFFTLIFASGILASTTSRAAAVVSSLICGVAIALFWVNQLMPSRQFAVGQTAGAASASALLTAFVLRQVFREGTITLQRIQGAVAVYLLLGLAWGNVYELIELIRPGAFRLPEPPANSADRAITLAYYSFVTLTTMGYGDIVPVHPAARSAAILEALAGQLFPAILIARLVAMEISSRQR